jgi:hypothetical protein
MATPTLSAEASLYRSSGRYVTAAWAGLAYSDVGFWPQAGTGPGNKPPCHIDCHGPCNTECMQPCYQECFGVTPPQHNLPVGQKPCCTNTEHCCSGTCADLLTDPKHCGHCDTVCSGTQGCCAGRCTDLSSNSANCGGCGKVCPPTAKCVNGLCACPQYNEDAAPAICGGACVDLNRDPQNCGGCGLACPTGSSGCRDGWCQECLGGLTACGQTGPDGSFAPGSAVCADITSDSNNCGSCGNACPKTTACIGGTCRCPPNVPDVCNGRCVNTNFDSFNCGFCGLVCQPEGSGCFNGVCADQGPPPPTCSGGQIECNGTCVDAQTDTSNCGSCGHTCAAGQSCSRGGCSGSPPCTSGQISCHGQCVNVGDANCGTCGLTCKGAASCQKGSNGQYQCQCVTDGESNKLCSSGYCCPSAYNCCSGYCCIPGAGSSSGLCCQRSDGSGGCTDDQGECTGATWS